MTRRLGWIVVLFCQLALVLASGEAYAQKRVALVIGNSNYQYTRQLANPVNDAGDLAAELTRVGFTVDFEHDLTKQGMEAAIARFARLAQGADAALFFYAGHGMQYRGENYLMPVDARLQDEFSLNFELTRLDDVLFGLERAHGVKILILDACRNNPLLEHLLRTTKSASRDLIATRGFAKVDVARGMLVAYSTQPNQVAVDGAGRNSPFTSALVKYIAVPGLEVGTLFRRVAIEVNRVTKGRQLPELSVSLVGEFYLNTQDTDVQAWSKIRATDNATKLNNFLKTYPASPLVAEAQEKLDAIVRQERAREQAEHDRQERERLAREEAERKRLEQEHQAKAAQEKLDKERIAQAAGEKEIREERTRANEDRARLAREDAERQRQPTNTLTNPQVAMLPAADATPPSSSTSPQLVLIPVILRCGPFSANPKKSPAFTANFSFSFSDGKLKADRVLTTRYYGKEVFEGSVSRAGLIHVRGHGTWYSMPNEWDYDFSGQVHNESKLNGRLSERKGTKGFRDCSITFEMPMAELRTKLGLLEADLPAEQKAPEATSKPETKDKKAEGEPSSKATTNGPKIFSHEPPRGVHALHLGEVAYIDDKSCPESQIKEMTGGALRKGIPRRYRCINRSSMKATSHPEKVVSRTPTESRHTGNATKESMHISGPGTIRTGQTVTLTSPSGQKMTCTGGSITHNIPRRCFWN